jgi:hypothetical protein
LGVVELRLTVAGIMKTASDFQEFGIALRTLADRIGADDVFAREVYASLCNMQMAAR